MSPDIEACCVVGANLSQPLGIAMLSPRPGRPSWRMTRPSTRGVHLSRHLADVNTALDPHEQLDCLVLIRTPWTVDNGFITPTFKVKRNRIEEAYAPLRGLGGRSGRCCSRLSAPWAGLRPAPEGVKEA